MMRFILLVVVLICSQLTSYATHNRGGYITYRHIGSASSKSYEVTITTCTYDLSPADRPELQICWGDGKRDTVVRTSLFIDPTLNVKISKYVTTHTYASDGTYMMEVYDPNRNADIQNITNSVNQPFCITTTIVVSPSLLGHNNSVQFDYCPCPEFACAFQPYCFNPAAFDPDGDSLSFELVPCRGDNGCFGEGEECCWEPCPYMPVPSIYRFLGDPTYGGPASIDPVSGTFCWTSPTLVGEYNIAILVHEWRKFGTGQYFEVGNVTLDYQITVSGTCENNAPSITTVEDTCIVAGTVLNFTVTATDPDPLDNLSFNAGGQPFEFIPDSANFVVPGNGIGNNLTGTFTWATNCSHVANTSYLVTFSVKDDDQGNTGPGIFPLADYESFSIRVIPPQVTGLTATAAGNTIVVNWTPQLACSGAAGYKIYRSNSPVTNTSSCCDANTALDLGYTYVGNVLNINSDEFIDNSNLSVGVDYCYVVVLYYNDGSVSCPSDPACAQLRAEFPIITRVSIDVTDLAVGTDTVEWFYPFELDTTVAPYNTGNFYYQLYRGTGSATPTTLVLTTVISSSLTALQSAFFDTNLNTQDNPYTYKVRLYHISTTGDTTYVGESAKAQSIYLTLTPNDNQIGLSWDVDQPWINDYYEIYRETSPGIFTKIDTTSATSYIDTGLTNGVNYCYRIKAIGRYLATAIPSPLINWSQETCAKPVDLTPPCPPLLSIQGDCETGINLLTWTNPNNSCADDVMSYNVYYSPTDTGALTLLTTINTSTDTFLLHNNNGSIAGCYVVTAVDSVQYSNESDSSNSVCMDNCPYYWLPNVFTPNGDGVNDLFIPFPYKYIQDIDLNIFNRWGVLVFSTTNKDILWDGKSTDSGELLVEGVYYYVCKVNTIRLKGIEQVELKGFVHVFYDDNSVNR